MPEQPKRIETRFSRRARLILRGDQLERFYELAGKYYLDTADFDRLNQRSLEDADFRALEELST